jgi:large subunit ribosomal protein L18
MERNYRRKLRHKRVRARIAGTASRPRLSIFRSNRNIFVQLIDDDKGITIASAGSKDLSKKPAAKEKTSGARKKERMISAKNIRTALAVGELIAKRALEKKISSVVFDRGGYKYHGVIKAVAEGARKGGLKF